MSSLLKFTVLATAIATAAAQTWSNNKTYSPNSYLSLGFSPSEDSMGMEVLNIMVNLTMLPVNASYTSTTPPYVALTLLNSNGTLAANEDVIFCYMSSYYAYTSTNYTTTYGNTSVPIWACSDFNQTDALSALSIAP
jgi:hypothetical protein